MVRQGDRRGIKSERPRMPRNAKLRIR